MRFDLVTLFPQVFPGVLGYGVVGRAVERGDLTLNVRDLRDWASDRHRTVDDIPYGGGAGMVLKPEPIFKAVREIRSEGGGACVLMSPQGRPLTHAVAEGLAQEPGLILVCGRYEGFDERVRSLAEHEISIGDYVLSGGELAAMVLVEAVARLVPGVLGGEDSAANDSFSAGLLEHPHYTRPADFEGLKVPDVLMSGNHELIRRWREEQALQRTRARRPDLLTGETAQATPRTKEKSR